MKRASGRAANPGDTFRARLGWIDWIDSPQPTVAREHPPSAAAVQTMARR